MCTCDFNKLLPMLLLAFQHTEQVVSTLYFLAVFILLESLIYIVKMCGFSFYIYLFGGTRVEVIGQHARIVFRFPQCSFQGLSHVAMFGSRCLYLISHITGPNF